MSDRRHFLKASLAIAASTASLAGGTAHAATSGDNRPALPPGLLFTREHPGMWEKKVSGHVPEVTVEGDKIKVVTHHSMSKQHYIVRHTLVSLAGEVLAAKTFYPEDEEPISLFDKPAGHSELYATSFCNKHDMWVTSFSV
jgi:superoxide reductase